MESYMADSRPTAGWPSGSLEWMRMAFSSSRVAPHQTGRGGGTCGSILMAAAAATSLVRRSWWELPNLAAMPGRGRKPLGGKKVEWARGSGLCSASGLKMHFAPWEIYCETLFVKKVENDRAYFQLSEMSLSRLSHLDTFDFIILWKCLNDYVWSEVVASWLRRSDFWTRLIQTFGLDDYFIKSFVVRRMQWAHFQANERKWALVSQQTVFFHHTTKFYNFISRRPFPPRNVALKNWAAFCPCSSPSLLTLVSLSLWQRDSVSKKAW